MRPHPQGAQRVLVGGQNLDPAVRVDQLDQLDHHRLLVMHHRHDCPRGSDEAQRDGRGVVYRAVAGESLSRVEYGLHRLDMSVVRGGYAHLGRVCAQVVDTSDVEHEVRLVGVAV